MSICRLLLHFTYHYAVLSRRLNLKIVNKERNSDPTSPLDTQSTWVRCYASSGKERALDTSKQLQGMTRYGWCSWTNQYFLHFDIYPDEPNLKNFSSTTASSSNLITRISIFISELDWLAKNSLKTLEDAMRCRRLTPKWIPSLNQMRSDPSFGKASDQMVELSDSCQMDDTLLKNPGDVGMVEMLVKIWDAGDGDEGWSVNEVSTMLNGSHVM